MTFAGLRSMAGLIPKPQHEEKRQVGLCLLSVLMIAVACLGHCAPAVYAAEPAQIPLTGNPGPFNAVFLEGGVGLSRAVDANSELLAPGASWSMSGWLRPTLQQSGGVVLAALGNAGADAEHSACRCLVLQDGRLALWLGGSRLVAGTSVRTAAWQFVAATFDGHTARLYLNDAEVAAGTARSAPVEPVLHLAPVVMAGNHTHFGGSWAGFSMQAAVLSSEAVAQTAAAPPDFDLIAFHHVGSGWPWQQRAWRGLPQPQDPWTLPRGNTPPEAPVARTPPGLPPLQPQGDGVWRLASWRLMQAPSVTADGAQLSRTGYDDAGWHVATVPGTVLTTLIDRGIYPDPDYGLNNMAIPESLARQAYWYRTQFDLPDSLRDRRLTLTFKGINYAAAVWVNGARVGDIRGAFARGVFDVTPHLRPGAANALAVHILPPPHPGIPHEESVAAGPGENGGNLAIDGPTFVASEGWDWIPGIRDRNVGIWQDVEIRATGALRLLDPHVITRLPLPATNRADVSITVPVFNASPATMPTTVAASFGSVSLLKTVSLAPGESRVEFRSDEFPELVLTQPRLWWPNGYGPQNLYTLSLEVRDQRGVSDSTSLRFGVRHITYELSLFDRQGRLRRVEVDPTTGRMRGERLIDVSHEAIRRSPHGWAASLTSAGNTSPAVRDIDARSPYPHLAIRVNGVPIAVRGGNWGTDDSRKRIARERLEPYFRLHQAANLNTIRNWLGQNTEEVFYDLADEYGLLVLNDFWASTQDFQVEPQDPALFLANARDVIARYRNHPSIALWFGRNEGVPQPILNEGLDDLVSALDGTRYFNGSSNVVNLQGSGPYNYRPPEQYFIQHAEGFSVEVGTPSLSTLESLEASIPAADRWPISDTLAYHDWHYGGNGDVATFMATLEAQFGAGTSLADFERKAQMMNYVTYRALFEGFHAHLWTRNSGRLLWMTHPAWPSNAWQIYSSDYDTHAAYYGVKKACEPVHVQMNLPDHRLAVVNTTPQRLKALRLHARVLTLDNRALLDRMLRIDAPANETTVLEILDLRPHLVREGLVLIALTLTDATGVMHSENLYWQGLNDESYRRLNTLEPQPVRVTVESLQTTGTTGEETVSLLLENRGTRPALAAKLTVLDQQGRRVLPAYYHDNYVSLLPGQMRRIEIECPVGRCASVALRGWNVQEATTALRPR